MLKEFDAKRDSGVIPETYHTYILSTDQMIKYYILCSTSLAGIAYLFYHSIGLSLVFSALSVPGKVIYCNYLAERRKALLTEQFKDVLYSFSASISTGRQIAEAIWEAEQNMRLIYREDSDIVKELSYMTRRINASNDSDEEILRDFARRCEIDDVSNFIDIYYTCRITGGDLIKVVSKAAEMITDKMVIEKEIRTLTAQKRFESKILTGIPILIIGFLQFASPDYFQIMYESAAGRVIMTAALLGIGFSYFWSSSLTKIKV